MKSIKTRINALISAASNRFFGFSIAVVLLFGGITTLRAQILYTQFGANNTRQLRQINADGSGDTGFGLPFSTLVFPAWTRDATKFAISAPNPNFPTQRSYNVYAINAATGATQQITRFTDLFDSQTGVTSYSYPLYKAFAPNQTAMAVSTDIGYSSGGTTTTPVLEVYSTTTIANPLQVHVHIGRNGRHHAGEGVDWSPTQNLLVTPVERSAPFQSGGGPGEVTALLLMEPVNAAVLTGHYRQLTFPRTDGNVTTSSGFLWGEHDYQPKFSPNGVGVAYVRSFQNFNINVGAPDPDIQSLRIVNVNTGADTEVLRLNAGLYVSSLDWSPDGTALVFEVGQQEVGPLGYQQNVVPATDEIYIINANGTNLRRLRTAGNGNPAWKPNGAAAPTVTHRTGDFDGDGKADVAVFRPSAGAWYLQQSQNGFTGVSFGASTDRIVPADYDGDGKTDVAVYRSGTWYLQRSTAGFTSIGFGAADDVPMPADYDGDGKADLAVFRPSSGTWYLQRSQLGFVGVQFGQNGDKPVAADYDGDGKADLAVYRSGTWYLQRSQLGFAGIAFGATEDNPVQADYDGDGKADVAVFRPSNGSWYLNRSQAGFTGVQFGIASDAPVPADYDGDGKTDVAVFRNGTWYLQRSQAGFLGIQFGAAADKPVEAAFLQ